MEIPPTTYNRRSPKKYAIYWLVASYVWALCTIIVLSMRAPYVAVFFMAGTIICQIAALFCVWSVQEVTNHDR